MRNFFNLIIISLSILFHSCYKRKSVDLVVHNADIHIMDDAEHTAEAMAIKDGKIIEVGPERQILNKYDSEEEIDAEGRPIYPGFTDCHGHLLSYAQQKLSLDLSGCRSMDELILRVERYQSRYQRKFILGRGWDESLWSNDSFPDNKKLNQLFPTIPVCLSRVDGHTVLANEACLKLAGITSRTQIEGGVIVLNQKNKCSGLLVDRAIDPVLSRLPNFPENELIAAIKEIEEELFQYGITGVHEAGIAFEDIALFRKLINQHNFKLNVYAMLKPSKENIDFAKRKGIYTYKNLLIRSFKVLADGALESRGALLKKSYEDQHQHFGVLTTPIDELKKIAGICEETGYQMNTHAIGDSANAIILHLYERIFELNKDHRWRIEHAQVVDKEDFNLFAKHGIFPSVQPIHAVSDQQWVVQRIGRKRMIGAYAYHTLMEQYGMLAIGTDFPVESIDPFLNIHAAVNRKNAEGTPPSGFYLKEQITLSECLKGMTSWAAFASFQENQLGTLEKGKDATFSIFENPITISSAYKPNFSRLTMIKGKKVYCIE
jgi:predicted amidohydrolase YtcJ